MISHSAQLKQLYQPLIYVQVLEDDQLSSILGILDVDFDSTPMKYNLESIHACGKVWCKYNLQNIALFCKSKLEISINLVLNKID